MKREKKLKLTLIKFMNIRPELAMVDSRIGKTNLHVPNDIIVDASMPNVVRDGGKMWNKKDELQDCIAMIPDRCYATIYAKLLKMQKRKGNSILQLWALFPTLDLMAQKAEEYGSHDKTFEAKGNGIIRVVNSDR